ncbi:Phosphonate-transporting ATPase [Thiorhodococcus drewsii AZ1]|uniref:Phosphonate-transporting ATPase n=1 Tax=Thiorhodococcus drewsii AZ1 TaxID=765913 RepID=G2DZC7_9GAMM|nr:ABC transporter ATP-binding protein [Thiorhodococcus drewsii]EGV32154.1 Phosphonate-transporting ATPase [Thiorhodococcus drewsii AZ1]
MSRKMISLENVTRVYNQGRPNEVRPVNEVSLDIGHGEILVLKGPSGSGKTSLLALVGCMIRPTSGRILVAERDVAKLPERFLTGVRRDTFGFVFQQLHLIPGISVLENVMLPLYPLEIGFTAAKRRALELTEQLGLTHRKGFKVEALSGGERQRVAIARALINAPQAILADEPTAHLDAGLSGELMQIFETLRGQGKTVVIATHDPLVHDSPLIDRVATMRDGRILDGDG